MTSLGLVEGNSWIARPFEGEFNLVGSLIRDYGLEKCSFVDQEKICKRIVNIWRANLIGVRTIRSRMLVWSPNIHGRITYGTVVDWKAF
jgi:hypothetical protein